MFLVIRETQLAIFEAIFRAILASVIVGHQVAHVWNYRDLGWFYLIYFTHWTMTLGSLMIFGGKPLFSDRIDRNVTTSELAEFYHLYIYIDRLGLRFANHVCSDGLSFLQSLVCSRGLRISAV